MGFQGVLELVDRRPESNPLRLAEAPETLRPPILSSLRLRVEYEASEETEEQLGLIVRSVMALK